MSGKCLITHLRHVSEYNPQTPDVQPAESARKTRRLVTGVDGQGRSAVVLDGYPERRVAHGVPTFVGTELWRTDDSPADNSGPLADPAAEPPRGAAPPPKGSVFQIVEMLPDKDWRFDSDGNEVKPIAIHATPSIDYAIVLSGEIWAVLDTTEVLLRAGDVIVQRGTSHAWSNRSEQSCVTAFVLIGGNTLP